MKTEEELEPVNYLDYLDDMKRVSHEVHGLSTEALKKETVTSRREEEQLREQIRQRKKVMAALHSEVRELEQVLNQ